MSRKLTMLSGLPASGKSTLAKKMVQEEGNTGRINRDDLRAMVYNSGSPVGINEHLKNFRSYIMKLHEYIDHVKLLQYVAEGLVTARHHPTYPLTILNYSRAAQSVKEWDDTLSKCRGLIFEHDTSEIVAIPFPKFWNYNDPSHPETLEENLPKFEAVMYEKVDGSLGIGFFYKNEFIIATRGSFESEQAKWANRWIPYHIKDIMVGNFDKQFTYLFEIVCPQDRKVVNYNYSGLVLLGAIKTSTGEEYNPDSVFLGAYRWLHGIVAADRRNLGLSLDKYAALDYPNEEGFVAVWYGPKTFRVKLKFPTYKKMHRLYFQTSTEVIWELMKTNKLLEYVDEIMDQPLKNWVLARSLEMASAKGKIDKEVKILHENAMQSISKYGNITKSELRKEFAARATMYDHPQLMFLLFDAKHAEYEEALWKIIRPKNSFFRKEEE